MPSVRGVRQLRRAKQGRSSGPVKPVHAKDVFSTPPLMPRSLASSPDVLQTDMSNSKGSASNYGCISLQIHILTPPFIHLTVPGSPDQPCTTHSLLKRVMRR
ncbi:unnamed protein product [Dibothriocephalus latus]|uniref:Uncharacterized protein n=1 Tax=Dibothriocephalus latus TaxID=60516 RepID=A0A3P7N6E4_DIBLA|nr:unnamed protein product [Dibothriocephalus latus]